MNEFRYVGAELNLFATACNWKSYWSSEIRPFVKGDILEVGAGIGSNTSFIDPGGPGRRVCLEPDSKLVTELEEKLSQNSTKHSYEVICGTLKAVGLQQFDTIVYIDVLEHIESDREELEIAASHLRMGGHLIVLSPAHQYLFTPFDAAVGHFRRYNRRMLRSLSPSNLHIEHIKYLDCAGMLASTANLLFLRQSMPTHAQLRFWDDWIIPVSRVADKIGRYSIGKSILGIWRRS